MDQLARLDKMTSVKRQGCFVQKKQVSKVLIDFSSNKSNNGNYKDLLELNEPKPFEAPTRLEVSARLEAFAEPF